MSGTNRRMRFSLRVHPAGLAMLAAALFFAPSGPVLAAVLALLWHEGAHLIAMALCGVPNCAVELTPFGGMADASCYERLSPGRQAVVALSGVLASALGAFLCIRLAPHAPFWVAFGNMHFSLAVLNCLPVWPLDGARAVMAVAARFGAENALRRAMLALAYVLGGCLAALGLYGIWLGHMNVSLLLLGPYLCYAAHESAISQSVRRMQRAQGAGEKLPHGGIMPVRALACADEPTSLTLTRLLSRMPPTHFHLLYVVNRESGRVEKLLTEQEMAGNLFSDTSNTK